MKNNEEGLFVKRLRNLIPAIEIKVERVSILFSYRKDNPMFCSLI